MTVAETYLYLQRIMCFTGKHGQDIILAFEDEAGNQYIVEDDNWDWKDMQHEKVLTLKLRYK